LIYDFNYDYYLIERNFLFIFNNYVHLDGFDFDFDFDFCIDEMNCINILMINN
jgi:hypothetical protein